MNEINRQFWMGEIKNENEDRIIKDISFAVNSWKQPKIDSSKELILWGIFWDKKLTLKGKVFSSQCKKWIQITEPIAAIKQNEDNTFSVITFSLSPEYSFYLLNLGTSLESAMNLMQGEIDFGQLCIRAEDLLDFTEKK